MFLFPFRAAQGGAVLFLDAPGDAYHAERARRLGVSKQGVGHALKRMNITFKKTPKHPKANDAARLSFRQRLEAYKAQGSNIIYIDESGLLMICRERMVMRRRGSAASA